MFCCWFESGLCSNIILKRWQRAQFEKGILSRFPINLRNRDFSIQNQIIMNSQTEKKLPFLEMLDSELPKIANKQSELINEINHKFSKMNGIQISSSIEGVSERDDGVLSSILYHVDELTRNTEKIAQILNEMDKLI